MFLNFYFFMIVMLVVAYVCVMAPMSRTEDSFMKLALSYFYMGSEVKLRVSSLPSVLASVLLT